MCFCNGPVFYLIITILFVLLYYYIMGWVNEKIQKLARFFIQSVSSYNFSVISDKPTATVLIMDT